MSDESKKAISLAIYLALWVVIAYVGYRAIDNRNYKSYLDYKSWFENLYVENGEIREQNEILVAENEKLTIRLEELTDKYNKLVRDYNSIAMVKLESEE